MTDKEKGARLPPTVDQIVESFMSSLRSDGQLDAGAIDRLNDLMQKGVIPKPDEIHTALFGLAKDGDE